jgi:hypothetical protein
MTRQTFFNLAALALLALLAINTASIARSLRRIERIDRHRLVGWYLMRPPIRPVGKTLLGMPTPIGIEDVKAPLSQWTIVETFTTEKEYEAYQHRQAAFPAYYGSDVQEYQNPLQFRSTRHLRRDSSCFAPVR